MRDHFHAGAPPTSAGSLTGSRHVRRPEQTAYVELARAESERGELVLRERRDPEAGDGGLPVVELRVNGVFVMDTLETSSEEALAGTALAQVERPRDVLIGGLGLGFTAHQVLTDSRVERLVVVEIEQALVDWMRDGTVPHGPRFLADERLSVVTADIRQAVDEAAPASYDLVLLDVDNGPGFLVHDENSAIYEVRFLSAVHALLRPGGAMVVWSAAESTALRDALAEVFGEATPIPFEVRLQGRDEHYWLYLARR
jgi:spermidine synthase